MELSQIQAALAEIGKSYADRRIHLFEVETTGLENDTLYLRGRVLEEANRQTLVQGLMERFPGLHVEAGVIEIARKGSSRRMAVATNLTSVHDGPSFLAEQLTQLLNRIPVEVLWEQGRWGFVRMPDGYLGWTYLPYLSDGPAPEATHLVTAPVGLLRQSPAADAALVTRLLGGTGVCAVESQGDYLRLELAGGQHGWLPTVDARALEHLPEQASARRDVLVADAFRMIGVPYLWGGCSANGIDCSGFAQLLHRWVGITIPRDADMQCDSGMSVDPPFEVGDLLFFGERGESRRITHVGISLGGWKIIHSSRSRNGVQVDDVQAVAHLRDDFLCAATYIGR